MKILQKKLSIKKCNSFGCKIITFFLSIPIFRNFCGYISIFYC